MAPKLTEKERNRQMKKEAIISIAMYVGFFVWWYFTGYGVAERGTPETYTYVLGLPMWFFLSSIVGYILFSIATIIVVRLCFKNFDLGPALDDEDSCQAENCQGDSCQEVSCQAEICQGDSCQEVSCQAEICQGDNCLGKTTSLLENEAKCQKGRAE